jgi:hypothetical protein
MGQQAKLKYQLTRLVCAFLFQDSRVMPVKCLFDVITPDDCVAAFAEFLFCGNIFSL